MKWIKRIALALVLTIALVVAVVYYIVQQSSPNYSGQLHIKGLSEEVKVLYDKHGVPHIYAQNQDDLYLAFGYIHAQERFFQMDLLRRIGSGTMSELLGGALVDFDKFFRTLGITTWANRQVKTHFQKIETPFQRATNAYLKGINEYLKTAPVSPEYLLLGQDPKPFRLQDFYHIAGYMGYSFAAGFKQDAILSDMKTKLGDKYLKDLAYNFVPNTQTIPTNKYDSIDYEVLTEQIVGVMEQLPVPWFEGSNSWVIGPKHSKNGKVLFSNDPHIAFSQPAVWYEAHLQTPSFNYYGSHLAGIPFGLIGHNEFMANGITMFTNDEVDYYREKVNPENPNQYWNKDHWEDFSFRSESILVKGGDTQIIRVKESRHGPIINEVLDEAKRNSTQALAAWWELTQAPSKIFQAFYKINHAQKIDDVRLAASWIHSPGLNIMYGDVDGNIAWWACARIPRRPAHVNSMFVLDGSSGKDDFDGYYPFSYNPKVLNPESGFIHSANNQPDTLNSLFVPGYYSPENRAKRIVDLLNSKDKWAIEDLKTMVVDDTAPIFLNLAKHMVSVIDESQLNANAKQALNELKKWDGKHDTKQVAPSVFYKWMGRAWRATAADELQAANFKSTNYNTLVKRTIPVLFRNDSALWWDNITTEKKETRSDIFIASLNEAANELSALFGDDVKKWTWGRLHTLEHVHAIGRKKPMDKIFNVGSFQVPGGESVINKTGFNPADSGVYKVRTGPSMRVLIDFENIYKSWNVIPTGQSGHFLSPFYDDQAIMYNQGELREQLMRKEDIQKQLTGTLLLLPVEANN